MNKPNNTSTNTSSPKIVNHTNFIEALKNAGGDIAKGTVKGFKDDLIMGGAQQMTDTIFNRNTTSNPQNNPSENNSFEDQFDFTEFMRSQEKERFHQRVKQEYDQQETVIFNRRQAEIEKKIDDIRIELQRLAKEIVHLDQSTESVIEQEVIDPGTYHLNFFDKLLKFMVQLRKRIVESRHWFAMQNQRNKSKSYFWQQANNKVSGTKFSQSQERQVATQTG